LEHDKVLAADRALVRHEQWAKREKKGWATTYKIRTSYPRIDMQLIIPNLLIVSIYENYILVKPRELRSTRK
jgi:hypothetical protein